MARPKTGQPRKQNMMLSVDAQTRINLGYLSKHYNESISMLVSEWAKREIKRIEKKTGKKISEENTVEIPKQPTEEEVLIEALQNT